MKRQKISMLILVVLLLGTSQSSVGSELELVWESSASDNIYQIEAIEGIDNQPGELVFATRNVGAGCGGGTPASAWKLILDSDGEVLSVTKKQNLSKIQNIRQALFESSDGLLFTGGGWCGGKPPYFSSDGGETWASADRGTHPPNSTFSIGEFNGNIYAGTGYKPYKGELYRWLGDSGSDHWEHVFTMEPPNGIIYAITEYKNKLFIANADLGHWSLSCEDSVPVYISSDGTSFNEAVGIPTCYVATDLLVVDGDLIAKVQDYQSKIWYIYHWNDNANSWEEVAPINLGSHNNYARMVSFNNSIYIYGQSPSDSLPGIYQSDDMGQSWKQIAAVENVRSMEVTENSLYLGTQADSEGKVYIYRISSASNLLQIRPSTSTVDAGSTLSLSADVQNATDVYGIQSDFIVDRPEYMTLNSITYGDFFDSNSRLEIPSESDALDTASSDSFSIAISHKNPALPVTGSGTLARMSYNVSDDAYGEVVITADNVVFSDQYGTALDSAHQGAVITVEHPVFITGGGTVDGSVSMPLDVNPAGTVITLENENGDLVTITVNDDGTFSITDLKDGTYRVWADNSPYFSGCTEIEVVDGQLASIGSITLLNGDVNGDGIIDIGDVTLLAWYFGMPTADVPESQRRVDLNSDGTVNIQDLAIVGANFGMERCQ